MDHYWSLKIDNNSLLCRVPLTGPVRGTTLSLIIKFLTAAVWEGRSDFLLLNTPQIKKKLCELVAAAAGWGHPSGCICTQPPLCRDGKLTSNHPNHAWHQDLLLPLLTIRHWSRFQGAGKFSMRLAYHDNSLQLQYTLLVTCSLWVIYLEEVTVFEYNSHIMHTFPIDNTMSVLNCKWSIKQSSSSFLP